MSHEFEIQVDSTMDCLGVLERLKKSPLTYNERDVVNTLAPLFLIGLSSFLQVARTVIRSQMSSIIIFPFTNSLRGIKNRMRVQHNTPV